MCMYNITLNDELISETRRSFASEADMDAWLQQQVEALLVAYNASRQATRQKAQQAIAAMRRQSEDNGNAAMTLDEINIEIRQARQARMLPDMPIDEYFPDMDKELYTPEEAYELTMKDVKAIYAKEYAV